MSQPELKLQVAVCDLLRTAYPGLIWWSTPNGGYIMDPRIVAKLKATGLRPGVPDLAFILPGGRLGLIEMKAPQGVVTPAQKEFMLAAHMAGALTAVCRSVDAVISILSEWGVPSRISVGA